MTLGRRALWFFFGLTLEFLVRSERELAACKDFTLLTWAFPVVCPGSRGAGGPVQRLGDQVTVACNRE